MVTTTTKTLNYSITRGAQTNSVNATITSTSGLNRTYLTKLPGCLKVVELVLTIVSLALVASNREEDRYRLNPIFNGYSYPREKFLVGEVYFLCAHTAVLTSLVILLVAYLGHTTSAMIIPRTTALEKVMHIILALLLLVAGIQEIVMAVNWKYNENQVPLMSKNDQVIRIVAGSFAVLNGLFCFCSFFLSHKEMAFN